MTANIAKSSPAALLGRGERTGTWTQALAETWSDYQAYRRTLDELGQLSDRQLADLGLQRGRLKPAARAAVYEN